MSKKASVVQIDNQYIKDQATRKRFEADEERKRHRFMGWLMFLFMLLFVLPTFSLVGSYRSIRHQETHIKELEKEYKTIKAEVEDKKSLVESLKSDDFVAKYARAKYYYSFEGETIYLLPDLVPQ